MKTLHTIYSNFAKRVLMALALITMGVSTAWGAETTWDFESSDAKLSNLSKDPISVSYAQNNGTNPVAISSSAFRLYRDSNSSTNGCHVTFTIANGYEIESITVVFKDGRTSARGKIDNGSYEDVFSAGNSKTVTISSLSAQSYSIQNQGSSTVAITSITITYSSNTSTPTDPYTVTFHTTATAETELTEEAASAGVTPPSMEPECGDWIFQGWSESQSNSETSTTELEMVTLTDGKYYPTADVDLYPVYTKTEGGGGVVTWNKVTMAPADWSGEYLIVNSNYAMTSDFKSGTAGEFLGASVTVSNNQVTSSPSNKMIWIVEKNGSTDQYSFKNKSTGTYANITGTNTTNAALSSSVIWFTISSSSTAGVWKINSVSYNTRCFAYYSDNKSFRTYANSSNTTGSLYRKEGSGSTTYYYSYPQCTTETTITLNPNGGTPNGVKEYTAKETSYTLPACPFTRTGYNFVGWATSANGNVVYIDQATINNLDGTAIDLYAQWTEKALTRYRTDCDACIPLDGYASINGTYHFFPGETITLTVTPPADDVPYTYQWQKFVEDEWEDIDGKTTTTYTKAEATIEDVGHYRCVVSANGYCDAIAEYNVKCLQLNVYYDNHTLAFTTPLEKVNATTAVKSVNLENAHYQYYFEITDGCENFYGFNGHIHSGWYENVELNAMNSSTHCGLQTTKFGTYIFTVDHSYLTDDNKLYPVVTVTYPASLQEADKVIYLDNHVLNWTHLNNADGTNKIYYRIGHETHNNKVAMNLVPGTANLYKVTTSKYENFEVWHIANNGCWSGENNSIYKTKTDDKWAATKATEFETLPVTLPIITITPTTSIGNGGEERNSNCEFFNYDITEGMKTWNAEVIEPTNGTITVKYTHHDGTAVNNFTSGNRDLAHTCLLTITATANEGYSLASLTVDDVPFTSGNIHTLTGNAVIKATFTINSYTVTWKLDGGNWGGDASDKVVTHKFGDEIQVPEKPTYDCHEFVEWNPTYTAGMKMPAKNLEFTAQWNKLSYTITFKDYDGTVLKTSTVECGETPTPPTAPTRGQDAMYEYEFAGWSPAITEVTGDQIYTATYNQTKRQYTVNWYVNGVQLHSEPVAAGDEVTAPVVNPIPCGAVLAGWTDAENGVYEHEVSELHEGAQPSIVILENKTFYAVFADYVNE